MKRNVMSHSVHQPAYPNAADPRYFQEKAIEILAAVLSGTGAITVMLFLVTLA